MTSHRPRRDSRGIVLIEVLVSLLIFAFGILGLVGLQAAMARSQTASDARARAGYLATEIIGQMWADRPNLVTYATSATMPCGLKTRCGDWRAKVAAQLPAGVPTIVVNGATSAVSVTINWSLPNGAAHVYSTNTLIR
jgi:type IV pilus assembly protein PilV